MVFPNFTQPVTACKPHMDLRKLLICFSILCYAFVCFLTCCRPSVAQLILLYYVQIPIFAAMGCCFCRGDYFQRKYHLFYLAFILWIVLSNWLKGNIFPDNSSNFIFVKFCALCGIALPFAHFLIDWERRNILHAFLCHFRTHSFLPVQTGLSVEYLTMEEGECQSYR